MEREWHPVLVLQSRACVRSSDVHSWVELMCEFSTQGTILVRTGIWKPQKCPIVFSVPTEQAQFGDDGLEEDTRAAVVPVPMLDMVLPPSFNSTPLTTHIRTDAEGMKRDTEVLHTVAFLLAAGREIAYAILQRLAEVWRSSSIIDSVIRFP